MLVCPKITAEGLTDANTHGRDIASVYKNASIHQLIPTCYNASTVAFRVSNNVITSQVDYSLTFFRDIFAHTGG